MFVALLKFSENRNQAGRFMEGHKAWIQNGFDDGVFLLAGSLKPDLGGAVVAHRTTLADFRDRLNKDPFVMEKIVSAEIIEIAPARADEQLKFLLG